MNPTVPYQSPYLIYPSKGEFSSSSNLGITLECQFPLTKCADALNNILQADHRIT